MSDGHATGVPGDRMDAPAPKPPTKGPDASHITITVNGIQRELEVMPWVTLLDLLRERLELTGTKKGCDHGSAGPARCCRRQAHQFLSDAGDHERRRRRHDDRRAARATTSSTRSSRRSSSTTPSNAATARPAKSVPPSA